MREMKRKSAPRMQDVEAPTERRVLIGCLETTASGRGISMHEICRQREKENRGRDQSNITESLGNCPLHFDFHHPCCPYMNLKLTKTCGIVNDVEHQAFGYRSSLLVPIISAGFH